MAKFKAGDRVYCPFLDEKLYKVDDDAFGSLYVVDPLLGDIWFFDDGLLNKSVHSMEDEFGDIDITAIFHATPENKSALETLYGMEFEAV